MSTSDALGPARDGPQRRVAAEGGDAAAAGDASRDAVAAALREIARYLALEGDRHRARAYERAASSIAGVADLPHVIAQQRLTELPGIGRSLAGVVESLAQRGTVGPLERLRARWPRTLAELATLVGGEKARRLHDALSPRDLDEVAEMCAAGRVRRVPGFGKTSEARLRDAIERRDETRTTLTLRDGRTLTSELARLLHGVSGVHAVHPCGPQRRWMEVVDLVALAVATPEPEAVAVRLASHPLVATVERSAGVLRGRLASAVRYEIHLAPPGRIGLALVRATGSANHVAALEARARERGVSLDDGPLPDEAACYARVGLPFLPPEVRDGTDELAAAAAGDDFADLVRVEDLRGAVHCHTTDSDGKSSLAEMAAAAAELGLEYLTVTDHSENASYAGGLTRERLRAQGREIAELQRTTPVRLLRGTEADILADGAIDVGSDLLADLDVVIASIHKRHRLDEAAMTRRLVTAIRQPLFKIWGHALGRILLHRDPIPCRFDAVLDALEAAPVAIEINGDPRRLDLEPGLARRAHERGARFVLSSDAHSTGGLANAAYAVGMARRARLRGRDVLNTLPAEEFCRAVRPGDHSRARSGSRPRR